MEQTSRKRGLPKLFLTKEMVEERRLLKRLCKNSCRNLQGNISTQASKTVPTSEPNPTTSSVQGPVKGVLRLEIEKLQAGPVDFEKTSEGATIDHEDQITDSRFGKSPTNGSESYCWC